MSKEAIKLALDTFRRLNHEDSIFAGEFDEEVKALEEALAKQEQGEPVAWESVLGAVARGWCYEENANKTMDSELAVAIAKEVHALYTTPQQRTWVGLDEEDDIDWEEGGSLRDLVEAVEAKLKEKNT
jgi:hypothetical protein